MKSRRMIDHTIRDVVDTLVLTAVPILTVNVHCFWTYSTRHHIFDNSIHPVCQLYMYNLDGKKQSSLYGYVFTYQSFVTGRLLPIIAAFIIAVFFFAHQAKHRPCRTHVNEHEEKIDESDVAPVRRFLLSERCALELRDRCGPAMLLAYLLCTLPYAVAFVMDKVLSVSHARLDYCFVAWLKVLQIIGQQLEIFYIFIVGLILILASSSFRAKLKRMICTC